MNAQGLNLRGIQFHYQTPYVQSYNLTLQYQLSRADSSAGYVASLSRHLETFVGSNQQSVLLPLGLNPQNYVPFPDFARSSSYAETIATANYHSLQAKYQHRFSKGLTALFSYTYSKTLTDAGDVLSGGGVSGFRAPWYRVAEFSTTWRSPTFDIRNAVSFSGTYDMPFGKGRQYMSIAPGVVDCYLGDWCANGILTLDTGQPQTIDCSKTTGAGTGCYALYTGADPYGGSHNVQQFYNPAAFTEPPVVTQSARPNSPHSEAATRRCPGRLFAGSISRSSNRFPSAKPAFRIPRRIVQSDQSPRFFAAPSSTNFVNTTTFGRITSTRDAPNDARELQFALKFYF